ncbi:hypothetical protein DYB31_004879 [Aphanomyces astaci]|uniref:Uncharacterized protein n=1 Tax=Aphanomyces astaci TaxID=112090 RepID=A0A397EFH7_APHAT|nr:hypothetical protein DYB31_004879 [Aphanomyces astaci]
MFRTASGVRRGLRPLLSTPRCSYAVDSFPRSQLPHLAKKFNKPESLLEPFIVALEDNWYTSASDIVALTSTDASTLNIPLRAIQFLQEQAVASTSFSTNSNTPLDTSSTFEVEPATSALDEALAAALSDSTTTPRKPQVHTPYDEVRIGKKKMTTYGLTEGSISPKLDQQLQNYLAHMTTATLGQQEPPIRMEGDDITLDVLIPTSEAKSAQLVFQYIQWLRLTRKASPNYCANMIRAMLKLAKYLHGQHSSLDPTYGDKAFDDIPVIRELRKMHKTTSLQSAQSLRSVDEEKCVMLGIFSGIPDRQRTLREIEIGRTLHQNAAGQWTITHGPDDYKTGKAYGERPPLVIPDHIVPYLTAFLSTWRQELKPTNNHAILFCNTKGEPATADFIYRTFTRAIYRLTGKKTNPHLLRDSIVTYLRGQSSATEKDLEALAIYMGHRYHMSMESALNGAPLKGLVDATERTPLVGKAQAISSSLSPSSYKSCSSPAASYQVLVGSPYLDAQQPENSPSPPEGESIIYLDDGLELSKSPSQLTTVQSLFFDSCLAGDAFQAQRLVESVAGDDELRSLVTVVHPKYHMTVLMATAFYDQPLVMRYLLDLKLCRQAVNAQAGVERHNATALMLVQSVTCGLMLLQAGAFVHSQNSTGMTPLHYAASAGHAGLVSLLLTRGADPNAVDHRGATALHWAVYEGFQYTAMLLVGQGTDMSVQDTQGQTALMIAAALNDAFLVKQLVLEGAPLKAVDRKGRTALVIATQASNRECIHALTSGASDRWIATMSRKGATVVFFWIALVSTTVLSLLFAVPCMASFPVGLAGVVLALGGVTCVSYVYVWLADPGWINNCVGQHNHRGFVVFLASLSSLCLLLALISLLVLTGVVPLVRCIELQARNIAVNLTTNEMFNKAKYSYLKDMDDEFYNPFDKGVGANCLAFWLRRN